MKSLENVAGNEQKYVTLPSFQLETGQVIQNFKVAYQTWGTLNESRSNVLLLCHALTGSANARDWWDPLFSPSPHAPFDPSLFFIICLNVLGSPYGSYSPISADATISTTTPIDTCGFPVISIRDVVRVHAVVLSEHLGIDTVACAIGGSLGGMQVLEWALIDRPIVKTIIPIACSLRQSAWAFCLNQVQREIISLSMMKRSKVGSSCSDVMISLNTIDSSDTDNNDNNNNNDYDNDYDNDLVYKGMGIARMLGMMTYRSHQSFEQRFGKNSSPTSPTCSFMPSALSYLNYQSSKFINRFHPGCYLSLLQTMDSHDVYRSRKDSLRFTQPALIIGISTDVLFPVSEQEDMKKVFTNAEMVVIESGDGHDGFLIEFTILARLISGFLCKHVTSKQAKS